MEYDAGLRETSNRQHDSATIDENQIKGEIDFDLSTIPLSYNKLWPSFAQPNGANSFWKRFLTV